MSILIINYGGPTVNRISDLLSELNINSKIIASNDDFPLGDWIGIILSGGPDHVYEEESRRLPIWINNFKVPVLGICYGMELIVDYLGGKIVPLSSKEYGPTFIHSVKDDPLLGKFTSQIGWMDHHDIVLYFPSNLEVTSVSQNDFIGSLNDGKRWWGVQFHPENEINIKWGKEIFQNFIQICK